MLDYLIVVLIIIIVVKIIFIMCGGDLHFADNTAGIAILLVLGIFFIVLIIGFIYTYRPRDKTPKLTRKYTKNIDNLHDDKYVLIRRLGEQSFLSVKIDMVEESKDGSPINEISGGYHEVFNIIVPRTTPEITTTTRLFTWTSSNGTVINFSKKNNSDDVLINLEKSNNVNVSGYMVLQDKSKKAHP
jgi:hypothetical protein